MLSAAQRAEAVRRRRIRHVWVSDGQWLRAVQVTVGISDNRFSELEDGPLREGQELVTGIKPKQAN
jgi:HlyD family secretion protein